MAGIVVAVVEVVEAAAAVQGASPVPPEQHNKAARDGLAGRAAGREGATNVYCVNQFFAQVFLIICQSLKGGTCRVLGGTDAIEAYFRCSCLLKLRPTEGSKVPC